MNRDLKPFKLSNEDIAELEYIKKENEFNVLYKDILCKNKFKNKSYEHNIRSRN